MIRNKANYFTAKRAKTAKAHHISEDPEGSIVQNSPDPLSDSHSRCLEIQGVSLRTLRPLRLKCNVWDKFLGRALLLTLGVILAAAGAGCQHAPGPAEEKAAETKKFVIEPRAIDLLKAASARLAAARTMTFTAVITYEHPSRYGPPLAYTTRSEVTLQRPDKLRVITPGDGPAQEFYYDGKTMVAFAPAENHVAIAEAPPTIDATLHYAFDTAAIYFPFTDVIVADPYKEIAEGLELAFYIGQSTVVGGTTTDMVAYATHGTFVQIWIGAEDKLPRRARAVYGDDPAELRHQADFSNWHLDPPVVADAFTSQRAGAATRIPFAHPNPQLPPGAAPPAGGPPAKP